jgi:hypothetical protein
MYCGGSPVSKVFFIDGSPLWVSGVKTGTDGVIRGFVENGHWNVSIDPEAKITWVVGDKKNRWEYGVLEVIDVPEDILDQLEKEQDCDSIPGGVIYIGMWSNAYAHYNDVIAWATKRRELPYQRDLFIP